MAMISAIPRPLRGLVLIAFLTLIVAGTWVGAQWRAQADPARAQIAVKSEESLTLAMKATLFAGGGLIDVSHDGTAAIEFGVPETWTRTEVRGVPIADVKATGSGLGSVAYAIPANAQVTFRFDGAIDELLVTHASDAPISIELTTVDPASQSVNEETRLMTDRPVLLTLRSAATR